MISNEPLIKALTDFFESQQAADGDFVGEQREWHLPRLNRAAKAFVLLWPIECALALGDAKSPYDEMNANTKRMKTNWSRRTTAERLQDRLVAMDYDVLLPTRIWIGRSTSSDLWRWQAVVKGTRGVRRIGAAESMTFCLKAKDALLLLALVDYN